MNITKRPWKHIPNPDDTHQIEDYPPLAGARSPARHCTGLLIMVAAPGLIVNVVTADVDVEYL